MIKNTLKIFLLLVLTIAISACSTLTSKNPEFHTQPSQAGHIYSGAHKSIKKWPCVIYASAYLGPLMPVGIIIGVPLQILDLGLSLVADTVILPFDLATVPEEAERETYDCGH